MRVLLIILAIVAGFVAGSVVGPFVGAICAIKLVTNGQVAFRYNHAK